MLSGTSRGQHASHSRSSSSTPLRCTNAGYEYTTCQGCLCWKTPERRGSDRKSEKVERGGSLKQDMHKLQTDLIAPRTVQLTEQTPVVADHTVEKVSHGPPPRCWKLRSVSG